AVENTVRPGGPGAGGGGGQWPGQERDVTLVQWTLVVPLKPLAQAKSRLSDTADDGLRPGLALAFAQDTVAAALACPAVRGVVVVTDDVPAGRALAALGAGVVPDERRAGLNAALAHRSEEHTSELQSRETLVCR